MSFNKIVRSIYDYMLKLSADKNAVWFLFLVAFAESSFFPIPPDIMIIPMVLALPKNAYKIAALATIASVLGGCLGYLIGAVFFDLIAEPILNAYNAMDKFKEFEGYYHKFGAWIVFGAGITPFPYKIITIASGVVHLNVLIFILASVFARGIRFYFVAWLLKK